MKNRLVKVFRNPVDGNYVEEITLTDGEISPIAIERNKGFGKEITQLISFKRAKEGNLHRTIS
ncbi:MAG: hypothetical protein WBA41_23880 [Rivularia sp. (in: cyanobacteria)]